MEQYNSQKSLLVRSLLHRSAAYQKGRDRKLSHLGMGPISRDRSHILQKDQLPPACQYCGKDHGNNTSLIHIDSCCIGHSTTLSHSPHILSQTSLHKNIVKAAESANTKIGQHRKPHHNQHIIDKRHIGQPIDQSSKHHIDNRLDGLKGIGPSLLAAVSSLQLPFHKAI